MKLLDEIRSCQTCRKFLPYPPKPVVSFSTRSQILIIGQAPGLRVQKSGIPWNDPSGERLRQWLGVSEDQFYDPKNFGIVPMGFCYPGKGKSGDLPPRPECAEQWMKRVLKTTRNQKLILLIGQYAQNYFLGDETRSTLTETVKHSKTYGPRYITLPHPSPRNNIWLKKNPWFEKKNLPDLKKRVHAILSKH